jgi:hypothetical protein
MQMSQSIVNLSKALCGAQALLENPTRDKSGYNYKYADLPQVLEKIKSAITPHGLAFIQMVGGISDNKVSVNSILLHSSGEYMSSVSEIYVDDKMKSKTQGVGSAITYLRRKSALSFFSMGEEDEIDPRIENGNGQEKQKSANNESPINCDGYGRALNTLTSLIAKSGSPDDTRNQILAKNNVESLSDLTLQKVTHLITILQKKESNKAVNQIQRSA